ncbi:MAG: spore germination protein [Clostridia bacterium]|nr:spore germination protein [Clostridia bacterium]
MFKKSKESIDKNSEPVQHEKGASDKKPETESIPMSIDAVKAELKQTFALCSDFVMREIVFGKSKTRIIITFIDGFVDKQILDQSVMSPVLGFNGDIGKSVLNTLKEEVIANCALSELNTFSDAVDNICIGEAVVFIDGGSKAFKIGVKSPEKRAVEQPDTEVSIKGPREGFTENLRTNTILLRRKIKNADFKIESMKIGKVTKTEVAICYIGGIAKEEIVNEVKNRISKIERDSLIGSGYIEQHIEDGMAPFFPMVGNSEKPDKVTGKLLEGRVAVIVDGTPTVLTVPFLFIETIQTSEDYFGEYYFTSFIRILRLAALFVSTYLPALYVALTAFHHTVIPFKLILTMAASREGIPFSSFTEAILMTITFEILREAGVRMPRAIGQAVSIVGAIVLGDAAISAGIASAPIVIVVSLTGICSFINPPLMKPVVVLRIMLLIASNFLGLFGIGILSIGVLIYLCKKRSFGIPYLTPFSPLHTDDLKDALIVVPVWAMITRPKALSQSGNLIRSKGKAFSRKEEKK